LEAHIRRGAVPGLIALVAKGGDVHVEVLGSMAFGVPTPMERDAIFRIASLTKPLTAAAAMLLVEDGSLRLHDPLDDLLPELAHRRVLRHLDAELDDTVPARRPITVEDLLTFRMGFGLIMAPPVDRPIQLAEQALELRTLGPPWPPTPHTPDEWIRRLGTLPLMDQPGEAWRYNTSAQVLGVLIQRAAGRPLEEFLAERLFGPLGMHDTGFSVPAGKRSRFTSAYQPDPETGEPVLLDGVEDSYWGQPPPFPDASAWLVSTIDDYWSFVQLLLNRGVAPAGRLLSERSVDLMTTDHLTGAQRTANLIFLGADGGWGFGMRVPAAGVPQVEIPGGYGWDGGTGTTWRSDVERDVTGIFFSQVAMSSPEPPQIFTDSWGAAYGP